MLLGVRNRHYNNRQFQAPSIFRKRDLCTILARKYRKSAIYRLQKTYHGVEQNNQLKMTVRLRRVDEMDDAHCVLLLWCERSRVAMSRRIAWCVVQQDRQQDVDLFFVHYSCDFVSCHTVSLLSRLASPTSNSIRTNSIHIISLLFSACVSATPRLIIKRRHGSIMLHRSHL